MALQIRRAHQFLPYPQDQTGLCTSTRGKSGKVPDTFSLSGTLPLSKLILLALSLTACTTTSVLVEQAPPQTPKPSEAIYNPPVVLPPAIVLSLMNTPLASACKDDHISLTKISVKQEQTSWCWVASATVVANIYTMMNPTTSAPYKQCELYDKGKNIPALKTCCNPANINKSKCQQPGWPEMILRPLGIKPNMYDPRRDGPLSWYQITDELCQNRPILYIIKWTGGGLHSLAASGYRETTISAVLGSTIVDMVEKIVVSDSHQSGITDIRYDCFVQDCAGKWTQFRDYLDIKNNAFYFAWTHMSVLIR